MTTSTMDADALLGLDADEPERLFPADPNAARQLWRRLSSRWHPDRNQDPRAAWVFAHVQDIYRAARRRTASGLWDDGATLRLLTTQGRQYRLHYVHRSRSELGHRYVGRRLIGWLTDADRAELLQQAKRRIDDLALADTAMRESLGRQLPGDAQLLQGEQYALLLLHKRSDFVPLDALIHHLGGSMEPRHVAWVLSGLLNLRCYLQWAGLCHQAIAAEHCLVSPQGHAVALASGWWFARRCGDPIELLPARSARLAPPDLLHQRRADPRLDALLLRQTGLDLLGPRLADAPPALRDFLSLPGSSDAVQDYSDWQRALWKGFGERRFSQLAVTADDVYTTAS